MAVVKAIQCIRPQVKYVDQVAALPYDVYNRQEAKEVVKDAPLSFLNIDRAETQFDDSIDTYDAKVYAKAKEILEDRISKEVYSKDEQKAYYLYQLVMDGRAQTGIVACASIDDYQNNVIKKHENTREEKEQDRIRHVDTLNAQTGPIFLAYRKNKKISEVVANHLKETPLYDFVSDDKIAHRVWKIAEPVDVKIIEEEFADTESIYIADGHHRAASAVKVGLKRRQENPNYDGTEEFNFFLSVLFPDEELMIMPYNRVVKDLFGNSETELIEKISEKFDVKKVSSEYEPKCKGTFGMFLNNQWYELTAHSEIRVNDPVKGLDVSVLQDNLLQPILGIVDPRTDARIDFVGGIRGLKELEKRASSDMMIAFSMYPTSIQELFDVADAELLMPPKSTWFEPKLRSGIFIHSLA